MTTSASLARTRHVVAHANEIKPGERKLVEIAGRPIALFNLNGEFFAIGDKCPHEAGSLCKGKLGSFADSDEPGKYRLTHLGEVIKCPWHGWEFDIRTGQSYCDPQQVRVRSYETGVAHGGDLLKGPYKAETFKVTVEEDYVVINL